MASGTPVVATDVPGLTDLQGGGVVLVPPEDPAALIAAVREILIDQSRWEQLASEARETVVQRYSWDAVRPQIAEVYRSVLGSEASQVA
jgi:glycosyltransferase involved in cell wall biosynthesis